MNRIVIFLSGIALTLGLLSCDKIEPPYQKPNDNADTTACPVPYFPAFTNPQQKVLLEEFTGHKCPNCPAGAATAQSLLSTYAGQMILVAIHAGFFAIPDNQGHFTSNYTIPEGEEIATQFGVSFNPIGMVNRKAYNSNLLLNPGDWDAAIQNVLTQQPSVFLQMIAETSATDAASYCIHTKVNFLDDFQGDMNLVVYITEDSLVSAQKTSNTTDYPDGYIPDYKHNHVLRRVLGGTWGKSIVSGSVAADSAQVHTFKFTPQPNWNLAKCEVVGFVYNTATDEIIQAATVHLSE